MPDPGVVPPLNPNIENPVGIIHPIVPELLGGGSGGTTVPGGKVLNHCVWKQIWQNSSGAPKDRTIEIQPIGAGELPGTITIFYAPIGANAPNGPPAPPAIVPGGWPKIPPDGGAAALNVPSPQVVFVHYDQGKNQAGPAQVRVTISQTA